MKSSKRWGMQGWRMVGGIALKVLLLVERNMMCFYGLK